MGLKRQISCRRRLRWKSLIDADQLQEESEIEGRGKSKVWVDVGVDVWSKQVRGTAEEKKEYRRNF